MKYCNYCMSQLDDSDVECPFCGQEQNRAVPGHHIIPGTILNNKYYVGASIGEGGFGITYIGRDTNLDMKVAIKEYYPNGYVNRGATTFPVVDNRSVYANDTEFFEKGKERFLREARILAKFSGSPGIVDVRDFFEENNTAYIVMEYLDGETLKEFLKRKGTMSPEDAVRLLMPVMISLKKVHQQGLIHRDISPDNIMLVDDQVKLLDFGAARNVSGVANKSLSVMLKPGYAPEEQYRSKGEQGPWTDIYALCATLYKCITGITPDDSTQRVYSDELKTPSALGVVIDSKIESAIMKGLSVLQKDRFQSIDELLDGFKGIRINRESDEKTVYAGKTVSEDDKETKYIETDGKTVADVSIKTEHTEETPVYTPSGNNNSDDHAKNEVPKKGTSSASSGDIAGKSVGAEIKAKKPQKKKRVGVILLSAVVAVVAIIAISTIFKALNSKTISGEKIDNDTKSVRLYNKNLTVDDMKALLTLGKLEDLSIVGCSLDNDTFKYIGDISTYLKMLSIYQCSGITDYSAISNLKYLTRLTIQNCGLTNDQFSKIELGNKDFLTYVCLEENNQLSDLKPLAEVADTLTEIDVDETAVSDFSCLADCSVLYNISAQKCKLTSLSSLTNKIIKYLNVNNNQISDISAVANFEYLRTFKANNNAISDISSLSGHQTLGDLYLNGNNITDISPLAESTYITRLEISDNQVESLLPLANCSELKYLYANRNKLSSLDGLQKVLQLKVIQVEDNSITGLEGISNCTIIEQINLNGNSIEDISVLAKSSKTLQRVYFNNNNVSNIAALSGTASLEYLSFDNNSVETLDPLKDSVSLLAISADRNKISSIEGLKNSTKLKYIYLPHNNISDMSAITNLVPRAENDFAVIDLSSNNISELKLTAEKEFTYLAVYNNPIKSYADIEKVKGNYFLFSYVDGEDYSGFKDSFSYFKVVDCPLDKQVEVRNSLGSQYTTMKVRFQTVAEADQETEDAKSYVLTGNTKQESTED